MKKFLATTIFVAALIFGGIQPAAAQDVYIKTYSDGRDIYVVTESIDTNGRDYANVTVKYIQNGRLTFTEHRNYGYVEDHGCWYKGSEEAKRNKVRPARVWNVAEDKVLMYCLTYR